MPESIFKQISLDILRLHQHTIRSLFATQQHNDTEIHDAVYITLDGRYYIWLPETAKNSAKTGILLIEDEHSRSRLSWITSARTVKQKDSLYNRVLHAIERRMQRTKNAFNRTAGACLLELTPQQGRLTTGNNKDFTLSPSDLVRALYPVTQQPSELFL